MNILIRTDGSKQLGNGHIIRMLALADELSSRKIKFTFALKFDDFWINKIKEKGFDVMQLPSGGDPVQALCTVLQQYSSSHLVYDTRGDLTRNEIERVKRSASVTAVIIDTPEDTRLAGDVVIFPPIPQVKAWSWDGFSGKIYSDWDYALLRKEFSANATAGPGKSTGHILLSFGSTDPFHLTEKMLHLVAENKPLFSQYEFILLAGPQFDRLEAIKSSSDFKQLKISVLQAPSDIVSLFRSVDFAFIAFGVTAYELSALSVPFLCICPTDDHALSARVFEKQGLGVTLGLMNNFADNFKRKMESFLADRGLMRQRIKEFHVQKKISDWNKIIEAIRN